MAAFKRPSKNSKIKKIEVENVLCPICQSILVEPVTLPCSHSFCSYCFKGTIENNALCCPLCRKRIGSWLRNANRQNKLVNTELWDNIQKNFSTELAQKSNGTDSFVVEEKPIPVLCKPGEIRSEYEDALHRARQEALSFEQKHAAETELLIRKLQQEDEEQEISRQLHQSYAIEAPLVDLTVENEQGSPGLTVVASPKHLTSSTGDLVLKHDVESFIVRKTLSVMESPIITDDNSSVCSNNTPATQQPALVLAHSNLSVSGTQQSVSGTQQPESGTRPYTNFFKDYLDRKLSIITGSTHDNNNKKVGETSSNDKVSAVVHGSRSLPVSLPYAALLSHGRLVGRAAVDTDSVDSMKQEFCCFKPIESTRTTSSLMNNKTMKVCSPVVLRPGIVPPSASWAPSTCQAPTLSGPTDLHCVPGHASAFVSLMKVYHGHQKRTTEIPSTKKFRRKPGNCMEVTSVVHKRQRPESEKTTEQKPTIISPSTRLTRRTSAARKEYYEQNGTVCSGDDLEQMPRNRTTSQIDEDLALALKLDAEWNSPVAKTRRYTCRNSDKPKRQMTLPDMMVGGKMKV